MTSNAPLTLTLANRTVHRLGFGAMRLTGSGIWGPPRDMEGALRVLKRAVELGVNFIDTADSYGPNVSEELIAQALHPYPQGLLIATKGGLVRPGPDVWNRDARPGPLRQACEGSLRRLKVERIELYQLHAPDPRVPYEASVGELVKLRDEGKIRHIGLSNVSVDQIKLAQKLTPVVSVQNRYNLADRGSDGVLEYCQEQGIAFIPWAPLGSSRLAAGKDTPKAVDRVAARHQASSGQVVIAWLLARSPVMLPIPGTASVAHLEENLSAASLTLTPQDLTELGSQ
ncbi:MAG TPA: aldo/keto reductase [Steroidobacteraceae bacterium]|jgi:aryl-alcohol dehydrogenase-like predicted oxidoreductase